MFESESERAQREHNEGQEDGADASAFDAAINDLFRHIDPLHTDDYYEGYDHGYSQQKNSDWCFLTTACVTHAGLPDDCHQLTILREFRDDYVMGLPNGPALVEEYYAVAPTIVQSIMQSPDKAAVLGRMFGTIQECVSQVESGCAHLAVTSYSQLFHRLCDRYEIDRHCL